MFAQSDTGGINITLPTPDWTTLVPNLVGLFFDAIGQWLQKAEHSAFDGLWTSGANVVGQTDLAMTWNFGPVRDQIVGINEAVRAILLFAVVLLGLKSMLGGLVHSHSDVIGEFVNGVLTAVILVGGFAVVVPEGIGLVNQAASAVGKADLSRYLSTGGIENPLVEGVLFIILLFFAVRLLMKAVWRMGFLAIMLPVGLLACALYAIPQTRWLLSWWSRIWGGMLVAQIPSVMALSIGAQMFAFGNGVGAFVYSIAFLQLATDLYSLIPFGFAGGGGSPFGSLPGRVTSLMVGGLRGGAATAAAAESVPAIRPQILADTYGYR